LHARSLAQGVCKPPNAALALERDLPGQVEYAGGFRHPIRFCAIHVAFRTVAEIAASLCNPFIATQSSQPAIAASEYAAAIPGAKAHRTWLECRVSTRIV
jgi:hypothetical protein